MECCVVARRPGACRSDEDCIRCEVLKSHVELRGKKAPCRRFDRSSQKMLLEENFKKRTIWSGEHPFYCGPLFCLSARGPAASRSENGERIGSEV